MRLTRRPVLVFLASAAAAVGAVVLAVLLVRKIRVVFAGEVLLTDGRASYTVRLQKRVSVTHDVRLLRFALKSPQQKLGFRVGEHVLLNACIGGRTVMRPYTPVSRVDHRGSFDIMVKIYPAGVSRKYPNGGLMSQYLDTLRAGDKIEIQGPRGRFVYEGRGQFATADGHRLPLVTRLGLVAAGSGVTPMLQLLRHLVADKADQTSVMMIDVNSSEQDIIARQELDEYTKDHGAFSIRHVLSRPPTSEHMVDYVPGPLNLEILTEHLPPPDSGTMVLCCGPPLFIAEICEPALRHIGHKPNRVLCF
ncbi:NADH-cytochrome b5 reductase 3-like [Rhipicephalus sanguineus]|uniref:NADH-cytochrome b5 reductase 3-like n=1 Tax=Rhipicephalus sanguineus TaxID=34632 RepID=UPI0020C56E30|nr:NADH-cytochrome b5 reductase 3-like [Rhipicephalus sanguineus]